MLTCCSFSRVTFRAARLAGKSSREASSLSPPTQSPPPPFFSLAPAPAADFSETTMTSSLSLLLPLRNHTNLCTARILRARVLSRKWPQEIWSLFTLPSTEDIACNWLGNARSSHQSTVRRERDRENNKRRNLNEQRRPTFW